MTYSYDVHGNVIEKVDTEGRVQYTYDSRQQLIRVDFPDGTSVSYAYDAFGRRVIRDETYWHNNGRLRSDVVHYLYDGLEVLKEYGGTPGEGRPPLAEYWRANGRVVAKRLYGNPTRPGPGNDDFLFTRGGLLYYHYDALGTVQAITDRHGDVLAQYYYDAYGQPWAGPLGAYNAYALTGKEYDAKTGLYYVGARWYDPQVGRWMSQDPARDGLNWYAYVGNSPTAYVDFWGLWRKKELEGGGHAFIAEQGDILGDLALGLYGDASMAAALAAHNGISDPDMIRVGQAVKPLPVYGPESAPVGEPPHGRSNRISTGTVVAAGVLIGETLISLSPAGKAWSVGTYLYSRGSQGLEAVRGEVSWGEFGRDSAIDTGVLIVSFVGGKTAGELAGASGRELAKSLAAKTVTQGHAVVGLVRSVISDREEEDNE